MDTSIKNNLYKKETLKNLSYLYEFFGEKGHNLKISMYKYGGLHRMKYENMVFREDYTQDCGKSGCLLSFAPEIFPVYKHKHFKNKRFSYEKFSKTYFTYLHQLRDYDKPYLWYYVFGGMWEDNLDEGMERIKQVIDGVITDEDAFQALNTRYIPTTRLIHTYCKCLIYKVKTYIKTY